MNVTPVVSSVPVCGDSQPQYKAVLTELWPCLPSKAWKTFSCLLRKIRTGPADPTRGRGPSWEAAMESRDVQSAPLGMPRASRNTSSPKG